MKNEILNEDESDILDFYEDWEIVEEDLENVLTLSVKWMDDNGLSVYPQ